MAQDGDFSNCLGRTNLLYCCGNYLHLHIFQCKRYVTIISKTTIFVFSSVTLGQTRKIKSKITFICLHAFGGRVVRVFEFTAHAKFVYEILNFYEQIFVCNLIVPENARILSSIFVFLCSIMCNCIHIFFTFHLAFKMK